MTEAHPAPAGAADATDAAAACRAHWDQVYASKAMDAVSWHQARPETSLRLIDMAGLGPGAAIVDVGGGRSLLVDALLERGDLRITVLDVSPVAIRAARERLGPRAAQVAWMVADVRSPEIAALGEGSLHCWHDRAVFHFLVEPAERQAYLAAMRRSLRPDGAVVMATFAEDGPPRCSNLPVARWSAVGLARELGDAFELLYDERELHGTPWGAVQPFTWCLFRRRR